MEQRRFRELRENPKFWDSLNNWWASLEHDRGQRAALRRAETPEEVFIASAFWRGPVAALTRGGFTLPENELECLALPIGVLAHAKTLAPGEQHFARLLGQSDKGGEAVRDARFRKLLAVGDEDRTGLFRMLLRLMRMLDDRAELKSLVIAGFDWNDDTRRKWARQYYTTPTTQKS